MQTKFFSSTIILSVLFALLICTEPAEAQQRNKSVGGGNNRSVSKPSGGSVASSNRTINGGSVKSPSRVQQTKSSNDNSVSRPKVADNKDKGNTIGSGNKVNIDNSKKNVNINVDNSKDIKINNSRNTTVRHNSRPYNRPPYRYGGRSYYCYHPYHYHPYRPYYWGPVWHPWGYFIATLATTAIIVSVNNQQYHYDNGVYYVPSNGGYSVVAAPVGATITTLPSNSQTVIVNETTNNYYYGGTYYEKSSGGYTVVAPTAGAIVENLPDGGEEVRIGDYTYVKVGETYYQPIDRDGKSMYEVVNVE
jgi:Family of unknown function (DUF6515)